MSESFRVVLAPQALRAHYIVPLSNAVV